MANLLRLDRYEMESALRHLAEGRVTELMSRERAEHLAAEARRRFPRHFVAVEQRGKWRWVVTLALKAGIKEVAEMAAMVVPMDAPRPLTITEEQAEAMGEALENFISEAQLHYVARLLRGDEVKDGPEIVRETRRNLKVLRDLFPERLENLRRQYPVLVAVLIDEGPDA